MRCRLFHKYVLEVAESVPIMAQAMGWSGYKWTCVRCGKVKVR